MKKIIFIFLLFTSFVKAQKKEYILDVDGKMSNLETLYKKYPNNALEYRISKDSGKIFEVSVPKYEIYNANYNIVQKNIPIDKKIIKRDSLIYLIQYFYKDDNTLMNESNKFLDKNETYLKFLNTMKKNVEKKNSNIKVIFIFEKGIDISLVGKRKSFIVDDTMFFKTHFFKKSIVCGSFLIIKPNGQSLVRNGEYRLDKMAEHLKPEIWNDIFKE